MHAYIAGPIHQIRFWRSDVPARHREIIHELRRAGGCGPMQARCGEYGRAGHLLRELFSRACPEHIYLRKDTYYMALFR